MNKKILITGFTRAACTRDFHNKSEIGLCTAHYSLVKCLEANDWVVDQRPVKVGEDVSGYDKVIVFLMHVSPFNINMYGALWTISQRPDVLLAIEDWQSPKNINTWKRDPEKILDSITNEHYRKNVSAESNWDPNWKPKFLEALNTICRMDRPITLPAHLNGDYRILFPEWEKEKIFSWYAPAYTLHRTTTSLFDDSPKERVFNFAGLIQTETEKWFNRVTKDVSWQIKQYGKKGDKTQTRLTEEAMVSVFKQHWGVLMAGYWHSGSGWWRARPQQVADVGSILICEDKEGALFGEPYIGLTCKKIEQMNDTQLESLAIQQKEAYYNSQPMDKTITDRQVSDYLNA